MKIVLAHNYYLQPGGEDTVFESDSLLLRNHGHDVIEYVEDNQRIRSMQPASVALDTMWSRRTYNKMRQVIRKHRPDIVQFYNTFPLISPAVYYACRELDIPVIQYLFNPRMICPAASLYRDGRLCTDCVGKFFPWPGVLYGCYHNSRAHTFTVASMSAFHRLLGTWKNSVDIYLSATSFYRDLYIKGGLPPQKIVVKPNYIADTGYIRLNPLEGGYALFVGRLDPEKGIRTLLNAWKTLDIPLKIRGSGQLEQEAQDFVLQTGMRNVDFIGRLEREALIELIRGSRFLIWPSEGYYETFGLSAVEGFSQGIPVIASNIGVMAEIVQDHETGLLFMPGHPSDLAAKVKWLWNHPEESDRMGQQARKEYEEKYTPEKNYQQLMKIYETILEKKKTSKSSNSFAEDQRHDD